MEGFNFKVDYSVRKKLSNHTPNKNNLILRRLIFDNLIDTRVFYQNRLPFIPLRYECKDIVGNKAYNQFDEYYRYYFLAEGYKREILLKPEILANLKNDIRIIDNDSLYCLNVFKYALMNDINLLDDRIKDNFNTDYDTKHVYYRIYEVANRKTEFLESIKDYKNYINDKSFYKEAMHFNFSIDGIVRDIENKDKYLILYHFYIDEGDTISIESIDENELTPLDHIDSIIKSELSKLYELGYDDIYSSDIFKSPFEIATYIEPNSFDDYRFTSDDSIIEVKEDNLTYQIYGSAIEISRRIVAKDGKLVYEDLK